MRTGKRRSAAVIISRGLPGIVLLVRSTHDLHSRFRRVQPRLAPVGIRNFLHSILAAAQHWPSSTTLNASLVSEIFTGELEDPRVK